MIEDDPKLSLPWAQGQHLSAAIRAHGGDIVEGHSPEHPILVIGEPQSCTPVEVQLSACYSGWSGGVVEARDPMQRPAMPLAGVIAGRARCIRDLSAFARVAHSRSPRRGTLAVASGRSPGNPLRPVVRRFSTYPPGSGCSDSAISAKQTLGNLGCLPYAQPKELEVYLVDFDTIVEANHATGLLTDASDVGRLKTRVVASGLEQLGHRTRLVERRFGNDLTFNNNEPQIALAGFDRIEPRRALGDTFNRVVDAGLGAGPTDYLDILIHTFPSQLSPEAAFPIHPAQDPVLNAAYEEEIRRRDRTWA